MLSGSQLTAVGASALSAVAAGALFLYAGRRIRASHERFANYCRTVAAAYFPWLEWIEPRFGRALLLFAAASPLVGLFCKILGFSSMLSLVAAAATGCFAYWLAKRREKHWSDLFEEQLPMTTLALADNVRAGLSLPSALERAAASAPQPLRSVLMHVVRAHIDAGLPQVEALQRARERVGRHDFAVVVEAVVTCYEKGGPLPQILERIAVALQQLRRFRGKIQSATSGARMGIRIMLATPVAMLFMLWTMEPESVGLLFTTLLGWVVLAFVASLVYFAFVWSRRILRQYI